MKKIFLLVILLFSICTYIFAQVKGRSNTGSLNSLFKEQPIIKLISPSRVQDTILADIVNIVALVRNISSEHNVSLRWTARGFYPVKNFERTSEGLRFVWNVQVERGPNEFEITATNDFSSSTIYFDIYCSSALEPQIVADTIVNLHALIFSLDKYNRWGQLVNPINDGRTLARELSSNFGAKVDTIFNPTQKVFLDNLRAYAQRTYAPNDELLVFFAGHGDFDDVVRDGYLVLRDSEVDDVHKRTYVSYSELRTKINSIPCKHILLVLDACFSGTIDPKIAAIDRSIDIYKDTPRPDFIKKKMQFKTRLYITSGERTYVPDGRPGQHSPFTRRLLEALRTYGGSDRIITIAELLSKIELVQPSPCFGPFGDNEPGSDFLFIAR